MSEQQMTAIEHARWLTGELHRLASEGHNEQAAELILSNACGVPHAVELIRQALTAAHDSGRPKTEKTLAGSMWEFVGDYHHIRMGKHDSEVALKTLEYLASHFERDGLLSEEEQHRIVYGPFL